MTAPRRLPALEPESAFYWLAGADGVLMIQHCPACDAFQHPPWPACRSCGGEAVVPRAVSGRGRVVTYTINHEPWLPGLPVPFVFAAIALEEQAGLVVLSNVLAAPETVHAGLAVEVCFERHEDIWLPLFRPLEPAHD